MKQILCVIYIMALCAFSVLAFAESYYAGNIHLFNNYDFDKGQYSIAGIIWHDQRHELQHSVGTFYTDDIEVLRELREDWVTEKRSPFYHCGYHYCIFVIKDRKEIESFLINVEKGCNTVVTKYGSFYFDPSKISSFKEKFKKPNVKQEYFNSCQEGRDYIQSIGGNDNFLLYLKPLWINYDGEFNFVTGCQETNFGSSVVEECLKNVRKNISNMFPGLDYNLEHKGSVFGKLLIEMKCNAELYNRFDLYEIYSEYKPYPPELTVYFKNR